MKVDCGKSLCFAVLEAYIPVLQTHEKIPLFAVQYCVPAATQSLHIKGAGVVAGVVMGAISHFLPEWPGLKKKYDQHAKSLFDIYLFEFSSLKKN